MSDHLCDMATPAELEPTAPKTWPELRAIVLYRDGYTCQTCGEPANEADHIWPKSKGGADKLSNLQALCRTCNRSKSDKLFLHHFTTDRLHDAIGHEMRVAVDAIRQAAVWLRLIDLIEEAGARPAPTVGEMRHLSDRAAEVSDFGPALDMLRELLIRGADPAVFDALAYIGQHDDFPVEWRSVLPLPVALDECRKTFGSLTVADLGCLAPRWARGGRVEEAAGAWSLVKMMQEESVLFVGDLADGFVSVEVAS